MTTNTEAMRLARDALTGYPYNDAHWRDFCSPAIKALEAALAQQAQTERMNTPCACGAGTVADCFTTTCDKVQARAALAQPAETDADLQRSTGEPHIDGWPLYSGLPPAASGEPAATLYVEVRRCPECQHIDINDDNDQAACTHCNWQGLSPEEDRCAGCGADGTMTSACIQCGHRTILLGAATLPLPATAQPAPAPAPAPAAQPGMVLVPLRMTQAMREVTDAGEWEWADLLAAANAVTPEQYEEAAQPAPAAQPCACFPGTCRGGEVINGRLANGQVCAAAAAGGA